MSGLVELYDATLRDGMQGEGMSLSTEEKIRVALVLDELGIDTLECGFLASNPKDAELFGLLERERFQHSEVAAFGMTRRRDVTAEGDPGLVAMAASWVPVVTIVGKTWPLHLEKIVKVTREENLALIADSVAYLAATGKRVIYDSEHFFDAYREDPDYALACLHAAASAGAHTVCPCDTNGSSLPHQVGIAMEHVVRELGATRVGFHGHDDTGCGVANTIAAVLNGAGQVQACINGYGERCGNANMTTIAANLELKLGMDVLPEGGLERLTWVSREIDELLNRTANADAPYVGRNAFAHKGGLHVAGIREEPRTFEHVEPGTVGNERAVLVSELSGRHTVLERAGEAGIPLSDDAAKAVLARVKEREHAGYQYEAANGSFELLIRQEAGEYEPLFTLESWRVIVEQRADGRVETEATIKIWVDGERFVSTAEGNGPVNALDAALRAAIGTVHPHLRDIELTTFKVRLVDESKGTDAVTRVLVDASDGHQTWGSIGVSPNVIAASWEALVDSLAYPEQPGRTRAGATPAAAAETAATEA